MVVHPRQVDPSNQRDSVPLPGRSGTFGFLARSGQVSGGHSHISGLKKALRFAASEGDASTTRVSVRTDLAAGIVGRHHFCCFCGGRVWVRYINLLRKTLVNVQTFSTQTLTLKGIKRCPLTRNYPLLHRRCSCIRSDLEICFCHEVATAVAFLFASVSMAETDGYSSSRQTGPDLCVPT